VRVRETLAVLCFIVLPACLFPLEIFLNGALHAEYDRQALAELSRAPPGAGRAADIGGGVDDSAARVRGVPLQDVCPLMVEAYRMDIAGASRVERIEDPGLAEELSNGILALHAGEPALRFRGSTYPGVTRIALWGEPAAEKELEVWISWEGTRTLKEEIRRFASLHDLDVKTVDVPKTASKLIAVIRGGGDPPDVVMIQSDSVPELSGARAIQSLDYLSLPGMTPKGLEAFRWGERIWAVPFYFDAQLLFYNPELLGREGSKALEGTSGWTLRDMERAAEELRTRDGVIPMAWNVYSAYWLISFQLGFGKERLVERDGGIRIDDAATADALAYLLRLMERGLLEPMERDAMITGFVTGRIGIILTGSYSIPHFRELGIPFAVRRYPEHPETGNPVSPLLDFKGFAITRKTRRPILARRLIQHLSTPGVQSRFCSALSKMPAGESAWRLMESDDPFYTVLAESAEVGTVVPPEPAYAVFKNTMWKLLRFVFSRQMTVAEALAQGQSIINAQLAARD